MRKISSSEARRYRRRHRLLLFLPFLGFASPAIINIGESPSPWQYAVAGALFLGFIAVGLLGAALYQRRLLRLIDPPEQIRRNVLRLSWFSPIGSLLAIDELLYVASRETEA